MVMVIVGVPLLFTSNQMAIRMAAGNIGVIFLLKSIQAMVTQPSINSLREYGMFLASTRDLSQPIRLSKKRKAFQKEDRSIMYWIAEGTRWLALYTFYCIGRILMAQYPLDPQGFGLVSPFDLNGMRDQIVFFILFWSQLELGYSVVFHL
ncbi:hypothetical protein BDR26DRAFT_8847 [Obelidium mucronatum]|nr:hypothetical protein BDR26DRAFT_8847 [Obelidium mucronatum]